jgi:hypothetical protein
VHMSVEAMARQRVGQERPVVVLNRFDAPDELHVRNAAWLRDRLGLRCLTSVTALADLVEAAARARPDHHRHPGSDVPLVDAGGPTGG